MMISAISSAVTATMLLFSTTTGEERNITWESTNHYFINQAVPPKDVEVVGGKTGTTSEAGACLVLPPRTNMATLM